MRVISLLESAGVIRRVHVEMKLSEPRHSDVRDITDSVYQQVSPLQSLCERAEHGPFKSDLSGFGRIY
jgi:hypothetical protein